MEEHDTAQDEESKSSLRRVSTLRPMAPEVDDLEELIESDDSGALRLFLALLHPADLALLFTILHQEHWPKVLKQLDISQTADLMEELPDDLRDDLAAHLAQEQLQQVIGDMASDDAADVLADLPEPLASELIRILPPDDRRDVESLLKYPDDSAGGLMQVELVSVSIDATVDQAVEAVREMADEVETLHFIYVVNDKGVLVGVVTPKHLILAKPQRPIRDIMQTDLHVVTPEVDQEQVAQMFRRYDLGALPVIDDAGKLLGCILHDDAVDVMEEEAAEDMLHMAGASPDEPELVYTDQLFKIASVRLPWLLATLAGLIVPALLVWAFQISFPKMLALVPFITVIGAMGGNVGTQSSTIVVRGFATGRVDFRNLGRFLAKELVVSFLMGIACGLLSGIVVIVWHQDWLLSATVSISMMVAVIVSAIMGVLVPYLFKLVRIDPAIAAGPAVTTIDDILAIAVYYLTALLILG